MKPGRLRLGGLALVCLGALVLVAPTVGFETLSADRGVTAETAQDPDALLGVVDNSAAAEADVTPPDQAGIVYYLDDNAGEFASNDLSADVVAFDGQATDLDARVEADDGTHDARIVVTCGGSTLNEEGHLTVAIDANADVSVSLERTTDEPIDVNCRSASSEGFVTADAGNVFTTGDPAPQTFSFEPEGQLGAQSAVEIDLSDAQTGDVEYGDAEVVSVSRDGNGQPGDAEFVDDRTIVYSPQGATGDEITIEVEGVEVTSEGFATYESTFVRTDDNVAATNGFWVWWWNIGFGFQTASVDGEQRLDHDAVVELTEAEARELAAEYETDDDDR